MKITEVIGATILGTAIVSAVLIAAAIECDAISLWQGFISAAISSVFGWAGYKIGQAGQK